MRFVSRRSRSSSARGGSIFFVSVRPRCCCPAPRSACSCSALGWRPCSFCRPRCSARQTRGAASPFITATLVLVCSRLCASSIGPACSSRRCACACCRSASIYLWRYPHLGGVSSSPGAWRAVRRCCVAIARAAVAPLARPSGRWRGVVGRLCAVACSTPSAVGTFAPSVRHLQSCVCGACSCRARFFPAPAGTPPLRVRVAARYRGGGARFIPARAGSAVRGTLARHRFIPATAGNPRRRALLGWASGVHPRARGVAAVQASPLLHSWGSSPRGRGNHSSV